MKSVQNSNTRLPTPHQWWEVSKIKVQKIAQPSLVMRSVQNQRTRMSNRHEWWNVSTIKVYNISHPPLIMRTVKYQNIQDCPAAISDEMRLIKTKWLPTSYQGWGVSKIKLRDCPLNITDEKCPTSKSNQMFTCHPWGKVSKIKLQDRPIPVSDETQPRSR